MTPTVHVLAYGRVLCGSIHGLPKGWGLQHRWVSAFDASWRERATCPTCREVAPAFERFMAGVDAHFMPTDGEAE